jgi:hypothetical protein
MRSAGAAEAGGQVEAEAAVVDRRSAVVAAAGWDVRAWAA